MRCSRAEELISSSLDGELSLEQTRELEEHVLSCPRCLRRWESLRGISTLFHSMPMARPSGSLAGVVMRRIEKLEVAPYRRERSWTPFVIAGLTVLSAIVASNLLLIAATYLISQSSVTIISPDEIVAAAWKIVPLVTLLGDIGWGISLRMVAIAQQTEFTLILGFSLVLTALWTHIIRNYRGVEVGR